jgi:hypothetical protein
MYEVLSLSYTNITVPNLMEPNITYLTPQLIFASQGYSMVFKILYYYNNAIFKYKGIQKRNELIKWLWIHLNEPFLP